MTPTGCKPSARDGFIIPEVESFLEERDELIAMAPELVAPFDMLLAISPAHEDDLLPDFPTFPEQFEMEQKKSRTWIEALAFQWRRMRESRQLVIKILY